MLEGPNLLAVNLFVQGMRRSGTTILYDALLEDPEPRLFYEPLREEKVTVGGGSGARDTDAFAETRELRAAFAAEHFPEIPLEEFNWGGPREPRLEAEPGLPEHCREWLRHLLGLAPSVAIKETRFYDQIADLAELDPGAALAHVVRDPRAVTASIMLGRGRRRERKHFPTVDSFFEDAKKRRLWSSYEIAETLLARPGAPALAEPTSVDRVLLVWKHTFESTRHDGLGRFGDRYLPLRNEDLRADPAAVLGSLYSVLGREVPEGVADLGRRECPRAGRAIRRPRPPLARRLPQARHGAGRHRRGLFRTARRVELRRPGQDARVEPTLALVGPGDGAPPSGRPTRFPRVKARVLIRPKEGILDPQGKAVERALPALGFEGVSHVRVGRLVELETETPEELDALCEKLLANPLIEDFEVELDGASAA